MRVRIAPFVILAVVLAGCQPEPAPKQPEKPSPEKPSLEAPSSGSQGSPVTKGKKPVDVEIVVAPPDKLLAACQAANRPVYTIYVDEKSHQVFHCLGGLVAHTDHGPGNVLSKADVPLSEGEQVRWFSTTHTFTVQSVVKGKEAPQSVQAPPTPFPPAFAFPKVPALEVTSAPVESVDGNVVQRYKVTFIITGLGTVDPDLICTM